MLKIGIIGLGNIAMKAYLPTYSNLNSRVDWCLYSSNSDKLETLTKTYGFKNTFTDLDELVNCGLDAVMIHTPTDTHAELIQKFLEAKIHVYVDKPISENIDEVNALLDYAKSNKLILMTGFNRRFAPHYQEQKKVSNKSMIMVQKHRENTDQEAKFAIFDMMIHCVDTLVYLLDEPIISHHVRTVTHDGILDHAHLEVHTENCTGTATINMHSGGRSESVEVMSVDSFSRCEDMTDLRVQQNGTLTIHHFSDWTTTLEKRGFVQVVETFLHAVEINKQPDTVEYESTRITHELVNAVYQSIK
ncbi:Gfo/Idh/MocA family oxidoreductase [Erysipelothrix inopinata]|uniref:Gfo/Idh/MocA family oxidoreductase n=1 Tax=Erysipelothrix inopinata TaxID=225084 RepID=A0A7G9S1H2_9FIRM|nr:Gfo/Idh/MocA family oxidoreductase [Erysipelothrix inopinata]QNN61697.1 Gfo/Idh/MocA family oxidoreductase [Erysipelothrix inopinata]